MPKRTPATVKFSKAQLDARYWEGWRAYEAKFHWDACFAYTAAGVTMLIATGFGVFLVGWGAYSFIHWASSHPEEAGYKLQTCVQNEAGQISRCWDNH